MTQEDTNNNLKQLTKDGQLRIEALKDEIRACKDKLESLQFGGPTGPASRGMVDEREMQLSTGVVNNDRAKLRFETVNKLLVAMKAGTEHLVDSLDGITSQAPGPPMSDETVVEGWRRASRNSSGRSSTSGRRASEASLSQTIRENGSFRTSPRTTSASNSWRTETEAMTRMRRVEDEARFAGLCLDRDFVKNNEEPCPSLRRERRREGSGPTRRRRPCGARGGASDPELDRDPVGRGTRPGLA